MMAESAPAFLFERYGFDPATGVLSLHYAYEGGEQFVETISFPVPQAYDAEAADKAFRLIFLLAGVSYYKAKVPDTVICKAFTPDAETAKFITKVYELGLAEFAFRNAINLRGCMHIAAGGSKGAPVRLDVPDRILVPVGGGKDSSVTLEALRARNVTLFALGGPGGAAQPIADTIRVSGMEHVYVSRQLSPVLMEMNRNGALNGHVPITAILSAIAMACAVLYGYRAVVMSNEHSASQPNFDDVNHQYSKSLEFEQDFADYFASHVTPDIQYFSFLRPLTEISIARRFAALPQYHDVFRSCNTAFRQNEAARGRKWCCNCPKCRFVFLALAPFVARARLGQIFGEDMLNDPAQADGFAELSGVSRYKPFECVGEVEESASVLHRLSQMSEWQNDSVVATLAGRVTPGSFDALFDLRDGHRVPDDYLKDLK